MREIGGKTVRLGFISLSCEFFAGFLRSMSETVSGWGLACAETSIFSCSVAPCLTGGGAACGAMSVSSCFLVFNATLAGFWGAVLLRADLTGAGLGVAVLPLVFVAIV